MTVFNFWYYYSIRSWCGDTLLALPASLNKVVIIVLLKNDFFFSPILRKFSNRYAVKSVQRTNHNAEIVINVGNLQFVLPYVLKNQFFFFIFGVLKTLWILEMIINNFYTFIPQLHDNNYDVRFRLLNFLIAVIVDRFKCFHDYKV